MSKKKRIFFFFRCEIDSRFKFRRSLRLCEVSMHTEFMCIISVDEYTKHIKGEE